MKVPRIQIPAGLGGLPLVSITLAVVWLVTGLGIGLGFHADLADADAKLRAVARQVIHQPELRVPGRLLPVAQSLMPGFESNEMFAFLRREGGDDGGAQERFDERAAAALAQFDAHPSRVLGLVPAQPTVPAFFSHTLVPASVVHGLLTVVIFLLAAPLLERLWGWRLLLPAMTIMALSGAGAYVLLHYDADRALLGGGAIVAGLVAAVLARLRSEEVDFLGWLPPSVSAELEAPAWVLGVAWGVYELVAWLSMPAGVPGLAHAPGFVAHAGGALAGLSLALGFERLGWEIEPPVVERKRAPAAQFDLGRVREMVAAGEGDEALEMLEAAVSRNSGHRDAVSFYFELCCERGEPKRAAPALAQLVRVELRRGAEDVAVARWRDLVTHVPNARLDPATLVLIATIVRAEGDQELVGVALQQVVDSDCLAASIAAEAARLAADVSADLARKAARVALADAELDAGVRAELEALMRATDAEEPKGEDVPFEPTGKELPPNAFFADQDRSAFGDLDDLSAVEEFPSGAVTEAVPKALDLEGIVLHSDEAGEQRVDYARVRAVSVVGVHGLGPKPILLIDLLVDGEDSGRPLGVIRLRSDRFDPRSLASDTSAGIEALRNVVGQILAGSEALPLPDAQSAVLRPPKLYESLAAYEQEVLTPAGRQLV